MNRSLAANRQTGMNHPSRLRILTRLAHGALVAAGVVIAFRLDQGILGAVVTLFVLIAPLEKLYPRFKGQKIRRPLLATDLGFAVMSPLLNLISVVAAGVVGVISLCWIPGLLLRPAVAALPASITPIVAFVVFDALVYWGHRWAHEVPFLWRFHVVHHSPEHMDWVSGFRTHPLDGVIIAPAAIFLLAAGFDPAITGLLAVFQFTLGLLFHANVRVRWRWLDRVVANPEFHHWHHANEPDAIGHNYGAVLPWWDLIFGTYFMPDHKSGRRPRRYGIDEYLPTTLIGQLTYPLSGARRYWVLWRHPVTAARIARAGGGKLIADIARSTRRPTHSLRSPVSDRQG